MEQHSGLRMTTTSTDPTNNTSKFSGVIPLVVEEICDNGLIDYNDPDCICCQSKTPVLLQLIKN